MRLIKYIWVFFNITIPLFFAVGCSSSAASEEPLPLHQYEVDLSLVYETGWKLKGSDIVDKGLESYLEDYLKNGVSRHIIRIYNSNEVSSGAKPVVTLEIEKTLDGSSYGFKVPVSLPSGSYVVKAWTDFREASSAEPYYDVSKFPQVRLDHHSGLTGYQDAFSGTQSFIIDGHDSAVDVPMTRPSGRYLLIDKDFSELLEFTGYSHGDVSVLASYTGFYPDTYSVITDRLTDSLTGEYYLVKPQLLPDGSAVVSTDFMLMNSGGSSAGLQLRLINKKGERVASSESLSVPMSRNELIVIKGNFLKLSSGDNGGFDMDTGFDGDFNITT